MNQQLATQKNDEEVAVASNYGGCTNRKYTKPFFYPCGTLQKQKAK